MQFRQICQLHIHAANLLIYHIQKVFYWIQIRWLGRPLNNIKLVVMFMKPVWYHAGSSHLKMGTLWAWRDAHGERQYSNSHPTICMPQQKLRFIWPGYIFPVLVNLCPLRPQFSVLCCCSPPASRFELCILRCFSAHHNCTEWLSVQLM